MKAKSQTPALSKGRWFIVAGIKLSLSALSVASALAGVAGVLFCVVTLIWSIFRSDYMFPLPEYIPISCGIVFLFCFSLLTWLRQRQIQFVAPNLARKTGPLPEVETLVRPSDLPPAQQSAELLRGAHIGQETAPEELLRATNAGEPQGTISTPRT
jgi:hypothetical protein